MPENLISPKFQKMMRKIVDDHFMDLEHYINGAFKTKPMKHTAIDMEMEREQRALRERMANTAVLDFGGFRTEIDLRSLTPYFPNVNFRPGDVIQLLIYVHGPVRHEERYEYKEDLPKKYFTFRCIGGRRLPDRFQTSMVFVLEGINGIGEESKSSDSKVLKLKPGAKRKLSL